MLKSDYRVQEIPWGDWRWSVTETGEHIFPNLWQAEHYAEQRLQQGAVAVRIIETRKMEIARWKRR